MESEPGHSGTRQCHVCKKISSQSDFKENSCRHCWKWFFLNCDEYFHKESKNICPYNCETVGMLLSCNSCRLKKFLQITQYRCGQRQCISCGCKTVINGKNPRCSCCRVLATKKCTCTSSTIPCSWCIKKASNKKNNTIDVEFPVANRKPSFDIQSTSCVIPKSAVRTSMHEVRAKSPVNNVIEDSEMSHATIHIDLSLLPKHLQAKAKMQVLGNCFVRICDLSSTIIKKSKKDIEERKAIKRPRSDSWRRNEGSLATAKISGEGDHGKLQKQKTGKERDSPDYNVLNVSDTRLIFRLGTEHQDTDVDSHVEYSHHMDFSLTNKEKSSFPRKNPTVKLKFPLARRDTVSCQGSKSESNINAAIIRRATVDKTTQTEPSREIECLQRRINELELIIASSRSCHTPSPLGVPLPLKITDDPTLTLSTPPSSDSGFSTKNQTPTKSACVLVNRLTKDVLEHYGVGRNSSLSPTEEPRPKKRPRLNSFDSENRSFKKSDKKNGGTNKKLELFGNDSEEDLPAAKDMLGTGNAEPFDLNGLDYDEDEDEESRPSNSYITESQQINNPEKTNEMDRHGKSSKSEKNEKTDKHKVKERKKKEGQKTKTSDSKSSKTLKEKGGKEISRPRKDQAAVGNPSKFRIPKLAASTTVGLPSLLQENLDQASKTSTSLSSEEPQSSRTPEPEPTKNLVANPSQLPKVSSNIESTLELPMSTSSFQPSGKVAPPILCIMPKNRNNKSVNFHEQLETVRSISPRSQLQEPEQTPEDPSSREKYIPAILEDLHYVPESSPREPVKGIRPFHPPVRKIDKEKLKSFTQERGGRRFIHSSSSSSSSENDSSESESDQENNSNVYFEKSSSQTPSLTAIVSPVEIESIAHESPDIQQNRGDVCTVGQTSVPSTGTIASDTLSTSVKCISKETALAVTDDSTKDISCVSDSGEHVQTISPKKSFLPSLAMPPSPRRHSPEPFASTLSAQSKVNETKKLEEDESEDEDVLDIGLNDEEIFDYGYDEDEHQPPPPILTAGKITNGSAGPDCKKDSQPSPTKTLTTWVRTNVPTAQMKTPVTLRSSVPPVPQPPHLRDEPANSRGLCHGFIRSGKCIVSDQPNKKCAFSHNLDSVLDHIQSMCNKKGKNIQLAARLVFSMANAESPLNKSLCEPIGLRMVSTVLHAIMMEKRAEQIVFALAMLNHPKLPMVTEFIDPVIQHTPASPANANQLVTLYERCLQNRIKISLHSFHIIIEVLLNNDNLKRWDFICNVVERAFIDHPRSYNPSPEVLGFLFGMALDQLKLERVCLLFSDIGHPALLALGSEGRREVLNRLRDFGFVDWYDRYSGIVRRPIENEMHSHFSAPKYPPNGMINHSSHDPALSLHRAQHSLPQTNSFQPPCRPPLYNTRPQIPALPPPGSHRPPIPSVPSAAFQRPPPPTIPLASSHRTQPPPIVVNHSIVSPPHPLAPGANVIRNSVENVTRPISNGTAPKPPGPLMPSIPVPPTDVDSLVKINESPPFIPLQVPKPSHSLAVNLFEPESPEVEPVFVDSEPEQGPSVVVEPSYGIDDELLAEYKKMDFEAVTRLFLRYYSGHRRCPMLASLVRIMKTNPLYGPEDNQELSPGDIFIPIITCVCEKGSAETLDHRQQQALWDLIFFILLHFLEMYNNSDEDEQIAQLDHVKRFLKMVVIFQLPLDGFIKHPELLLFVAECFLPLYSSKAEEEDSMEGIADDICRSINFLTEFHEVIANTSTNVFNVALVEKEMLLSNHLVMLLKNFEDDPEFVPYANGVLGVMVGYESASLENRNRFRAIVSSQD